MKNNIGFFTHETDAYSNRKFLILRAYYGGEKGWAMEARFWALNCIIGRSNDSKLDLNQKGERAVVARELEISTKELADFIVVLRDEAELVHDDDGILWTQQTQDDLERAMVKRENASRLRNGDKKTSSHESEKSLHENKQNAESLHESEKSLHESEKSLHETHVLDKSREEKIGEEKIREERASAPVLSFETFSKSIVETWNASGVKPAFRFTTSAGLSSKEREGFSIAVNRYKIDEVREAIKNYAEITQSHDHDAFPKGYGLAGFLGSGIEQYLDDADPWTRCRKPENPANVEPISPEAKSRIIAKLEAEKKAREPPNIEPPPPDFDDGFTDDGFDDRPAFVFDAAKEMAKIRHHAGLREDVV